MGRRGTSDVAVRRGRGGRKWGKVPTIGRGPGRGSGSGRGRGSAGISITLFDDVVLSTVKETPLAEADVRNAFDVAESGWLTRGRRGDHMGH